MLMVESMVRDAALPDPRRHDPLPESDEAPEHVPWYKRKMMKEVLSNGCTSQLGLGLGFDCPARWIHQSNPPAPPHACLLLFVIWLFGEPPPWRPLTLIGQRRPPPHGDPCPYHGPTGPHAKSSLTQACCP